MLTVWWWWWCVCVCVCVTETADGLSVSVRLEPQVSLSGGIHVTHNQQHDTTSSVVIPDIKVDRFTVTNADFMCVQAFIAVAE